MRRHLRNHVVPVLLAAVLVSYPLFTAWLAALMLGPEPLA